MMFKKDGRTYGFSFTDNAFTVENDFVRLTIYPVELFEYMEAIDEYNVVSALTRYFISKIHGLEPVK